MTKDLFYKSSMQTIFYCKILAIDRKLTDNFILFEKLFLNRITTNQNIAP